MDASPGSRPRYFRPYEYYDSTRHVLYQPNNDPRETGSGASAIYSFYALPPRFSGDGTIEIHVSSDEAVGATVKKLKTIVKPKCLDTEDDLTNGSGVHRS